MGAEVLVRKPSECSLAELDSCSPCDDGICGLACSLAFYFFLFYCIRFYFTPHYSVTEHL